MKSLCLSLLFFLAIFSCQTVAQQAPVAVPPLYRIFQNGLFGFIDSTGAVRIQPVYANAEDFSEGLAAVRLHGRFGYINLSGAFVIQPEFDYAEPFKDRKAQVWIAGKCFQLDREGHRMEITPTPARNRFDGMVDYGQMEALEKEAQSYGYAEITPVYQNRRFARDDRHFWYLTDAKGVKKGPGRFEEVFLLDSGPLDWNDIWKDGLAFVESDKGVGAIDMEGNYKVPVRHFDFKVSYFGRIGNFILLSEDISIQNEDYNYRYGFWNWSENTIVPPTFYAIDRQALLHGGLIQVLDQDRMCYIDRRGHKVWQEKKVAQESLAPLNVDYMLRSGFLAASPPDSRLNGFGGWGRSDNMAQKISAGQSFVKGRVQLQVNRDIQRTYQNKYRGLTLALANTTTDTLVLDAMDSRLFMYLQALDSAGQWRDIMYLPSSGCGNSYHQVFLAPGAFWDFTVPDMAGEIPTKLRVKLKINDEQPVEIMSNEFDGAVNPAQFWRKLGYAASSIMDPYQD